MFFGSILALSYKTKGPTFHGHTKKKRAFTRWSAVKTDVRNNMQN